jgi:hypothetical protein
VIDAGGDGAVNVGAAGPAAAGSPPGTTIWEYVQRLVRLARHVAAVDAELHR